MKTPRINLRPHDLATGPTFVRPSQSVLYRRMALKPLAAIDLTSAATEELSLQEPSAL